MSGAPDSIEKLNRREEVKVVSYDIGEKPGKGTYRDAYGHTVTLDDDSDVLPPCGICGAGQHTRWTKIY